MKDIIIVITLTIVVGLSILYVYKQKRKGRKCIGCPYADSCGNKECKNQKSIS